MERLLLAVGVLLQGQIAQVEVLETQRPAYASRLVGIEEGRVLLRQDGSDRAIPLAQILRLTCKSEIVSGVLSDAKPAGVELQLIDGSQFIASKLSSDGKSAAIDLTDRTKIELPIAMIGHCVMQPLNETQRAQWLTIVASRIATDQLVVIRSAEALDTVEGVINGIDSSGVKFEFDGQSITAPLAKLAGLRFFSKVAPAASGRLLAVVRDKRKSSWLVSKLVTSNSGGIAEVVMDLMCGSRLRLPLESIDEIDFSFGSRRFLAELTPLNRTIRPRFELTGGVPEGDELFGAQFLSADSHSGPAAGPGIQFLGSGSITYRVPEGFQQLLGTVELSPEGSKFVPCKVTVFIEEKIQWEKLFDEPRRPESLELAVESGKRVKLVVEAQAVNPVGDLVLFKQLRFVK